MQVVAPNCFAAERLHERAARVAISCGPKYAVIFTSQRTEGDRGYEAMAQAMFELALKQPGCLGAESVRDVSGLGITVANFTDEPAIHAWKQNSEHLVAQRLSKERWYSHDELRVAKVERAYSGPPLSRSF